MELNSADLQNDQLQPRGGEGGTGASTQASPAGTGIDSQIAEQARNAFGAAKDVIAKGGGPVIDQARGFAKAKPFATAALVGVVGLAFLNTLRGRR